MISIYGQMSELILYCEYKTTVKPLKHKIEKRSEKIS